MGAGLLGEGEGGGRGRGRLVCNVGSHGMRWRWYDWNGFLCALWSMEDYCVSSCGKLGAVLPPPSPICFLRGEIEPWGRLEVIVEKEVSGWIEGLCKKPV